MDDNDKVGRGDRKNHAKSPFWLHNAHSGPWWQGLRTFLAMEWFWLYSALKMGGASGTEKSIFIFSYFPEPFYYCHGWTICPPLTEMR